MACLLHILRSTVEDKKNDFLKVFFFKKADGLIFIQNTQNKKYSKAGFCEESIFIANNTIQVLPIKVDDSERKKDFLFVGSLYVEKGIKELLDSYLLAYEKIGNCLNQLIIIGKGKEKHYIDNFIKANNLEEKNNFDWAIYDQETLKSYFERSILCISPKQAGLSLLMSMGYATCFVTNKNSITGGEILNISNTETGLLYSSKSELVEYIIHAHKSREKFITMGLEAKKYYEKHEKPENMAGGLLKAINYVLTR